MDWLLYWPVAGLIRLLQALPLTWAARLGRWGGAVAYCLDTRHRRVAEENMQRVFGHSLGRKKIKALVREHFRRLGENYASAVKTAAMTDDALRPYLEIEGLRELLESCRATAGCVVAVGHFGNFELYARAKREMQNYHAAVSFRAFNYPWMRRLMDKLRAGSGVEFFDRRTGQDEMRVLMARGRVILGLLSDQHAGRTGAWMPFLGHLCSTTTAPALMAQRYRLPLFTAICYRMGLARWRIEFGREIPTRRADGSRRPKDDIMREVNEVFERAVRQDPPNWFWVHRRWREPKKPRQSRRPEHGVPSDMETGRTHDAS